MSEAKTSALSGVIGRICCDDNANAAEDIIQCCETLRNRGSSNDISESFIRSCDTVLSAFGWKSSTMSKDSRNACEILFERIVNAGRSMRVTFSSSRMDMFLINVSVAYYSLKNDERKLTKLLSAAVIQNFDNELLEESTHYTALRDLMGLESESRSKSKDGGGVRAGVRGGVRGGGGAGVRGGADDGIKYNINRDAFEGSLRRENALLPTIMVHAAVKAMVKYSDLVYKVTQLYKENKVDVTPDIARLIRDFIT